ncbi:MAG: hypothetical protein RL281_1878, partial [Pseudomonadota bacterium]
MGHQAKVKKPEGIVRLDYEPELVFVIGKRALGVKKADAFDHVVGVTILNDLTCRDLQQREVASGSRFWTAKNIPGFGPLGPEIITMDEIPDPYNLWMTCSVNGEERMRVNTSDQIWKLPDIIEHFSQYIPIEPGDMFSTGAPGGVAVGKPLSEFRAIKPLAKRPVMKFPSSLRFSNQPIQRSFALSFLIWLSMLLGFQSSFAQTFPAKPVTIIVPFTPAGGADTLARILVPRLNALWGQSVIVEYKAGASGQIGADFVSKANPDGYTLLMATTAVINDKNVSRFTGVSLVSADAYVLVVHPSLPINNASDLIAYAKANPKKLSFGSSGIGAASHLSGELFKAR